MKCCIADFNIEIMIKYIKMLEYCNAYITDCNLIDLSIPISQKDYELERMVTDSPYSDAFLETTISYRKLAEWLPNNGAFVLHSACFDVDGEGVAFAAHSGTGKTTHMRLWQELLGDKMVVVNGDKPIVRFFEDEPEIPYAYGTPWNGKERLGCNMRTPLKHICFIERNETNYVEPMEKSDAINRIFNQVYMPKDPMAVMNTMQLIDRLLSSCKLWTIHCNMEPSAAETAYKTIFGK